MATNPATESSAPVATRTTGGKPGTSLLVTIALHIVLGLGALVMIFPFIWMVLTSLKDLSQAFLVPPKWIPDPFVWGNYARSFQALPFGQAYFNSFYITLIVVVSSLFTASLAAYAFAKIEFPFREPILVMMI